MCNKIFIPEDIQVHGTIRDNISIGGVEATTRINERLTWEGNNRDPWRRWGDDDYYKYRGNGDVGPSPASEYSGCD